MFWKRKLPATIDASVALASDPVEQSRSKLESLQEAADKLASALSSYSEEVYRASQSEPDPDLEEAEAKVSAARKLVTEGRLAYCLGRCLPEHMKYWPSWSQRDGFEALVGFEASEIVATSSESEDGSRKVKVATIDFTFNQTKYTFVLRDRGFSYVPDTAEKLGEVELHANSQRVAIFDVVDDVSKEYSEWQFRDVRALKVGPWMKDVIDMATQIEVFDRKRTTDFLDDRTKNAARDIDLG